MSKVDKLSIRGIRSFSPEREQTIEFLSPLTMIVGANGCGKTTVIECLKYATTGLLPPGARSGQSFVHDPKVSHQQEVKAAIKLRFQNRAGQVMVCIRSFQLKQMKKSMQFKALDGVIRTTNELGERVSMSHKCSELDRQLPQLIGVSRAIMENVIFCHQEDSSWPLQEGAVLKKKFDDIFESTRYSKALDAIRKSKTEYSNIAKDLNVDLAGLNAQMQAAEDLQADLDAATRKKEAIDGGVEQVDVLIEDAKKEFAALEKSFSQIQKLEQGAKKIEGDLSLVEGQLMARQQGPDETFAEDEEELVQLLNGYEEQHQAWENEVTQRMGRVNKLKKRIKDSQASQGDLSRRQGGLRAEMKQLQQQIEERDGLVSQLALQHNIPQDLVGPDLEAFEASFREKQKKLSDELKSQKEAYNAQNAAMLRNITDLKGEQRAIESQQQTMNRELDKNQEEQRRVNRQMQNSVSGRGRVTKQQVDEAKHNLEQTNRKLADANNDERVKKIKSSISQKEKEMRTLKVDIDNDKAILEQLSENSNQQQKLYLEEGHLEEMLRQFTDKCDEYAPAFKELGIALTGSTEDVPAADLELQMKMVEQTQMKKKKESARASVQQAVTSLETKLADRRDELSQKRKVVSGFMSSDGDLKKVEDMIGEINAIAEQHAAEMEEEEPDAQKVYNYTLEHAPVALEKIKVIEAKETENLTVQNYELDFNENIYHRVNRTKQKKGVGKCPCCKQTMDDNVMKEFEKVYQKKKTKIQGMLVSTQAKQNRAADIRVRMEALMGTWNRWRQLQPQCNELTEAITTMEEELSGLKEKLSDATEEVSGLADEITQLNALSVELTMLKTQCSRIDDKKAFVDAERRKFESANPYSDGRTLQEVQLSHKQNNDRYEDLMTEKERLGKEKDRHHERVNTLYQQRNNFDQDLKELQERFKRINEMEVRKEELRARQESLHEEIKKMSKQLSPLIQELKKQEAERTKLQQQWQKEEQQLSNTLHACKADFGTFERVSNRIKGQEEANLPGELEDLERQVSELDHKLQEDTKEVTELEPEIIVLREQINDKEMVKQKIEKALEIHRLTREKDNLQQQLEEIMQKIGSLDQNGQLRKKMKDAQNEVNDLRQRRAHASGQLRTVEDQINHLTAKLKSSNYYKIEDKHRNKLIEFETTQMAVQDLEKYWTALDKALMRYHRMKIEDINKIIRELWQITYQGEDIDQIEIVSGEEGSSTRAGRSYNYRVCMQKGDATLDMKGRCSAGQRVLASIVIRLALAETFCLNCGILALDEPTTNLDTNNKHGLASALAKIISSRSKQTNFQLLTITHDEEFVAMMRNELATQVGFSMPEYFYRISREELHPGRFYSKIERNDWAEL